MTGRYAMIGYGDFAHVRFCTVIKATADRQRGTRARA